MADGFFQLTEPHRAVEQQIAQDQNLPFITDQSQRSFHRAGRKIDKSNGCFFNR